MEIRTNEKLRNLRESKNLTQIELARKAGISLSSTRLFEQGARVSNNIKRKVAYVLGVTLADIGGPNIARFTETENPEENKIFNEQLQVFFNALCQRADELERENILFDDDNLHGFQEFLYLARKYEVEIPGLHVRK